MIEISRHIEILLLDNDCVIVPELGGFMAHYAAAEYVDSEGVFYPPTRTVGFNPQLQLNDSLLAQSYIETYDISYPEALRKISAEVEEIKQHLSIDGEYYFHGIGTLTMTMDEHYDFHPCESGLLSPSLYALNSFELSCIKPKASTIEVSVEPSYQVERPRLRYDVSLVKMLTIAAMLLLLFVLSSIPAKIGNGEMQQCSLVSTQLISKIVKSDKEESNLEQNTDTIVQAQENQRSYIAGKVDGSADVKPEVKQQENTHYYVLVVAARVSKSGANDLVSKLRKNGFTDTNISERTSNRKVIYGHYNSEGEALNALQNLKNQDITFTDAWISRI